MSEPPRSALDDASLVARAKRGDREAFGWLYERYLDPLYRYVQSHVGNPHDAEDLTEQVFLRAYQALEGYQPRGHPFSAFLYKVARNLLIDKRRLQKDELPIDSADVPQAEVRSMDERLIDQMENEALRNALAGLPSDYAEVIRLRMLLGLPTETVAAWMGRSQGSIRVLQYRALKALRKRLGNA
jgi:RNA polymerase sigma-70 factor (ECF subfamily)